MSSSGSQVLVVGETTMTVETLGSLLRSLGFESHTGNYPAALARLEKEEVGSLVLVPQLPPSSDDKWEAVAAELTRVFELIQRYVRQAAERGSKSHLVAVLPATAAMGDASDVPMSALAGGMLSLFRTLALEFKKLGMTANVILIEPTGDEITDGEDLAALVKSLVTQRSGLITGQEIYACRGNDAGRLHP